MDGYEVFRRWVLEHTELYVDKLCYNTIYGFIIYVKIKLL